MRKEKWRNIENTDRRSDRQTYLYSGDPVESHVEEEIGEKPDKVEREEIETQTNHAEMIAIFLKVRIL